MNVAKGKNLVHELCYRASLEGPAFPIKSYFTLKEPKSSFAKETHF